MNGAIPGLTSAFLLDQIHDRLVSIRDANLEIFEPSLNQPPVNHVQAFLNGSIGTKMPTPDTWKREYEADEETRLLKQLILDPSRISKDSLSNVNFMYRHAL